jgi:hypothetical protein
MQLFNKQPTLGEFPNLAESFSKLKIAIELNKASYHNSIFGMAIKKGLDGHNLNGVLQMIRDQAKDNRPLVADIVGENLLLEIENL